MAVAFHGLVEKQIIPRFPVRQLVAATSVGIVQGQPMLDLKYDEDSIADVDMNVVMTGERQFVEIQGTAEHAPFGRERLDELLALAEKGIGDLFAAQREALPFDCAGYGL